MRYDYFLANLLFGLTLLTAFMSAAHFLGDLIVSRTRPSKRISVAMRVMILGACTLASLLLFLMKLSGSNFNQAFFADSGVVEPRLVKQAAGERDSAGNEGFEDLGNDPAHSWTLYNLFTEETESELRAQLQALKLAPPLQSLVSSQSSADCRAWRDRASALGLKVQSVSSIPASKSRAFLLVCVSDPIARDRWEALRDLATEGGSIFFVGRMTGDTIVLSQLLQARSWRQPDLSAGAPIMLGGPLMAFGGMPSGFRIDFGTSWANQPGRAFVEADGDALFAGAGSNDASYAALVTRNFAKGRVAWTSLPADLGERARLIYGPYWDLLTARVISQLGQLPIFGLESRPDPKKTLVIPLAHAQFNFKAARDLASLFKEAGVPASFYFVMTEALADRSTFERLLKAGGELGASDLDHEPRDLLGFFTKVRRYGDWRRVFDQLLEESLPAESKAHLSSIDSKPSLGVFLPAGSSSQAGTFAAIMANRFDFVVGDPFGDWTSPYRLMMEPTDAMRSRLAQKKEVRGAEQIEEITVLPLPGGDDFRFIVDGRLLPDGQVLGRLLQDYHRFAWAGGPFVFPVHTQVLAEGKARSIVSSALGAMKEDGASFSDARSFVNWWKRKSSVSYKLEVISPQEIRVQMTNVGSQKATDLNLRVNKSDRWKLVPANGAAFAAASPAERDGWSRMSLKELGQGRTEEWVFRKDAGTDQASFAPAK